MAFSCNICLYMRLKNPCFSKLKVQLPLLQARSQSFRDEGNSSNTVDAKMSVLRCRMEQVRMKERLDTCYRSGHGWNYRTGYDVVHKKPHFLHTSFQLHFNLLLPTL